MTIHIDNEIKRILSDRLKPTPSKLREAIEYSVLGPGKRIRPRLLLSTGEALKLDPKTLISAAASIEFIHAYTLIHDDLPCMDNDDTRRGRPTTHKAFDEGTALLAGDSLIPLAFETLSESIFDSRAKINAVMYLAEISGAVGVVAGQSLETEIRDKPSITLLERIFSLKTGALFRGCTVIPALLSNQKQETIDQLGRLGVAMGIAFQVADDLEDEYSESNQNNPIHIRHYMDTDDAILWAESRLNTAINACEKNKDLELKFLNPYIQELKQKLLGAPR